MHNEATPNSDVSYTPASPIVGGVPRTIKLGALQGVLVVHIATHRATQNYLLSQRGLVAAFGRSMRNIPMVAPTKAIDVTQAWPLRSIESIGSIVVPLSDEETTVELVVVSEPFKLVVVGDWIEGELVCAGVAFQCNERLQVLAQFELSDLQRPPQFADQGLLLLDLLVRKGAEFGRRLFGT